MFRHDELYYHSNGVFFTFCDCKQITDSTEKVKASPQFQKNNFHKQVENTCNLLYTMIFTYTVQTNR